MLAPLLTVCSVLSGSEQLVQCLLTVAQLQKILQALGEEAVSLLHQVSSDCPQRGLGRLEVTGRKGAGWDGGWHDKWRGKDSRVCAMVQNSLLTQVGPHC